MALSWRGGRPVATREADTIAGVLAVRHPVPESVARMATLVDDFVLVGDDEMIDAIRVVADTLGILLEPGGVSPGWRRSSATSSPASDSQSCSPDTDSRATCAPPCGVPIQL